MEDIQILGDYGGFEYRREVILGRDEYNFVETQVNRKTHTSVMTTLLAFH